MRTTTFNIKSNRQVFLASVATVTIAFSIIGIFLVVFVNLNSFLTSWNKQVQLVVYLKDKTTASQRKHLDKFITANEDVESTTYISSQSAWNNFKNTFSGKSEFLSDLEFNPLPASYNVQFKPAADRLEKIREFARLLSGKEGVESLEYGEKWIAAFERFMIFIEIFLFAVGGLVGLGLILIIANTIKLSFYSRKEEIELMLLIGATPRHIKIPFYLEGLFQGLIGGLTALGLIKLMQIYINFQFQGSLDTLARGIDFQFIPPLMILSLVAAGGFIGWLGSLISINQFLYSDAQK